MGALFFRDAETALSQSPQLGHCHDDKDFITGPEAYPSCFVTYMSLLLAMLACGSFNLLGARRELWQSITFEEV
jgi:hypothetical protein